MASVIRQPDRQSAPRGAAVRFPFRAPARIFDGPAGRRPGRSTAGVRCSVTTGPYRVSRNPMYAGQAVALVGAGLATGSWWPLAAASVSMLATTRLVTGPEEDYLADRFGDEYAHYRSRVRRWL